MTNVVKFASKRDIAGSCDRNAALAILGPQIAAIARAGEHITQPGFKGIDLAVADGITVMGDWISPSAYYVRVQWDGARSPKNRSGVVFTAHLTPDGKTDRPMRWQRGAWERLLFDLFPLPRTA